MCIRDSGMVWYGTESMVCYEISMLCYAMVYVVKDNHSATVHVHNNLYRNTPMLYIEIRMIWSIINYKTSDECNNS